MLASRAWNNCVSFTTKSLRSSRVAFDELGKLKKMYLSGNKIGTLASKQFNGLKNLEELDLSFNQIAEMSLDSFDGLVNLKRLNLSRNELTILVTCQFIQLMSLDRARALQQQHQRACSRMPLQAVKASKSSI